MKARRLVISIFVIVLFSGFLSAQDAPAATDSLTLMDCIKIALDNNPTIKSAAYNRESAAFDKKGSYQGILPRLDLNFGVGQSVTGESQYTTFNPTGVDSITGDVTYEQTFRTTPKSYIQTNSLGMSIKQNIYDGGIWWNRIGQAKSMEKSSDLNFESERNNVILSIEQAYYTLMKDKKLLEVRELAVSRSQEQYDRAEKMYEIGATAQIDVFRAKVSLGKDRINMLLQQNLVTQSRKNLNIAMGRDPLTALLVKMKFDPLQNIPPIDDLIETAYDNQPLLKKNTEDIKVEDYNISLSKGSLFPRISAYANYNRSHEDISKVLKDWNRNYRYSYGIQLSYNIFNGFNDNVNVQKAKIRKKIMRENFEDFKRQLKSSIHQYYVNYQSYLNIIAINRDNLAAAKEELRLAEERYQIGAGTSLDVRTAQLSLTEAEQTLVAALFTARVTLDQLNNQLGLSYENLRR
jgi:outer membrane protein TolC